jgi:hypothetical protein
VRIQTTVGTRVKEDNEHRDRVREVTRIEEKEITQDNLSFLRGETMTNGVQAWMDLNGLARGKGSRE